MRGYELKWTGPGRYRVRLM